MGDIYTSYGPFVGKVCENTNTQLCKENIIESITSSITENSNKDLLYEKSINLLVQDPVQIHPSVQVPVQFLDNTIKKVIKIPQQYNQNDNYISIKKTGGEITKKQLETNNVIEDESNGFFNYKVSIFNFKISIWILILILLIVICIGYFIYKYWYLKNTNIITYKKNSSIDESENKLGTNKNTDLSAENTTENTTDDSSSGSSKLSNND